MIQGEVCFIIPVWCIMCCLLKWDLSFPWKNIIYLFICCGIGASQGKLCVSPGRGEFLPYHLSLPTLCIWAACPRNWDFKKSLGVPNSQPSEKAMALLGFPTAFVKLMGLLLWSIFCKESRRNKRGGISHVYGNDDGLNRHTSKDVPRKMQLELETAGKGGMRDPWKWISWLKKILQEFN